jgi:sulfur carrier protein
MKIEVNGKPVEVQASDLAALLKELEYGEQKVATALNRQFVRAADREKTQLKPGDAVEVVVPRQGG